MDHKVQAVTSTSHQVEISFKELIALLNDAPIQLKAAIPKHANIALKYNEPGMGVHEEWAEGLTITWSTSEKL